MDSLWNLVQYHGIKINARTILELREELVASMEQHPMLQNWMSMFWGSLKTNFKRSTCTCTCLFYPLCTCNCFASILSGSRKNTGRGALTQTTTASCSTRLSTTSK